MMNNSMLMGTSCSSSTSQQNLETQEPKLENFLGRHSFSDHHNQQQQQHEISGGCNNDSLMTTPYNNTGTAENYMFQNCSLQLPSDTNGRSAASSSIGLSMIKTWLRNQPAPIQPLPQQPELLDNNSKNDIIGGGCGGTTLTSAQTLSLSMSTGGGSGGDSSSSDNNKQPAAAMVTGGLDSQTGSGAIEAVAAAVPRKSIDTFGQRTSIYRGVTRLNICFVFSK